MDPPYSQNANQGWHKSYVDIWIFHWITGRVCRPSQKNASIRSIECKKSMKDSNDEIQLTVAFPAEEFSVLLEGWASTSFSMHLVLLPPVFEEVKPQSISLLDISIGIFLDCSAETDNGASIASGRVWTHATTIKKCWLWLLRWFFTQMSWLLWHISYASGNCFLFGLIFGSTWAFV